MAKSTTGTTEEVIKDFSSKLAYSLNNLEETFVHVKAELRNIDQLDLDKSKSESLVRELDTTVKGCDQLKDFLTNAHSQCLDATVKIYKQQEDDTVQKRNDPGRSQRVRVWHLDFGSDSGVYSADSRVMSSSNMPVTQETNSVENGDVLQIGGDKGQVRLMTRDWCKTMVEHSDDENETDA